MHMCLVPSDDALFCFVVIVYQKPYCHLPYFLELIFKKILPLTKKYNH